MKNMLGRERETNAKGGGPLHSTDNNTSVEQIARQTWLNYYNDYLRDKGVITEDEWRKMRRLIG